MGKKRKSKPMRPWCWYCEKDFEDDKVLVTHQRAKHFKCEECNKKLTTAGGMVVHSQQVHKINIYKVPNAIRGRDNLDIEIFGMEGIPEQDMIEHELRIQANNQNGNKKPKTTGSGHYGELSLEQLQQQMAAHKAGTTAISPTMNTASSGIPTAVAAAAVTYPPLPTAAAVTATAQQQQYYGYGGYTAAAGGGAYGAAYSNAYYPPPPPPPPQQQQQQQQQQYPTSAQANFGYHASPAGIPPPPLPPQQQGWGYQPYMTAPTPVVATTTPVTTTANAVGVPPPPHLSSALPPPPTPHTPSTPAVAVQNTSVVREVTPPPPPPITSPSPPVDKLQKKKASKVILIYNNNEISPEEQRALLDKHRASF